MNADEIIFNMLTKDSSKILSGCSAIKNLSSISVLQTVAREILPKKALIVKVKLGGGIILNKHWLELAFIKLEISMDQRCLCAQYLHSQFYDPVREQDYDNIIIDTFSENKETWSSDRICRCLKCGQIFQVHGEGGWHVPWWKWSQA